MNPQTIDTDLVIQIIIRALTLPFEEVFDTDLEILFPSFSLSSIFFDLLMFLLIFCFLFSLYLWPCDLPRVDYFFCQTKCTDWDAFIRAWGDEGQIEAQEVAILCSDFLTLPCECWE